MKPKLGRKVYCIYGDGILVDTVRFIGKDSFIIDSFGEETEPDSWEWQYDMYDNEWFTSLSKAKEKLVSMHEDRYDGKLKITKITDTWYALEFC